MKVHQVNMFGTVKMQMNESIKLSITSLIEYGNRYDPFAGLGTVPLRAMLLGRYGVGHELNPQYFLDGAAHLKAAEQKLSIPTLFDMIEN